MMVGNNLKDTQLQQIVDKTILFADKDEDGRINFEEFCSVNNISLIFICLSILYKIVLKPFGLVICKTRYFQYKPIRKKNY